MTRAIRVRLCAGLLLGTALGTAPARACVAGHTETYLSPEPPARAPDTIMLPVDVTHLNSSRRYADARLVGPYARLSRDGSITLLFGGGGGFDDGSCRTLGPRTGFVIGTLARTSEGDLTMIVTPVPYRSPYPPRRDPGWYDRYIVDPRYRSTRRPAPPPGFRRPQGRTL